ncbi:hypothetical protein AB0J86_05110 [Micromonospora sp. NPDC049559]|uniref:hypothetical protein n=1 Tax=Micromonospora sp. NPDC049559 TaxID=3155923 RepID=UPI00343EE762
MRPARELLLQLSVGQTATALATNGQQAMWNAIEWMGGDHSYFNMVWTVAVPKGRTLDDVCVALGRTVERYATLRTTYTRTAEELLQVVESEGVLKVSFYDGTQSDLDHRQKQVATYLGRLNFDSATEWPLRVAVLAQDGAPISLVLVINHMALDLYGWRVVEETLTGFLADPAAAPPPREGWEPLDQAAFESSPDGRAMNNAALCRLRDLLYAAPPSLFDFVPAREEANRFWTLQLESRALATALPRVAQRVRASSSAVLLTVMSEVFGVYSGHREALVQILVSNRLIEDSARMAGYLCWDSPIHVDLRGLSFDAAVQRVFSAALEAYQHGLYRPSEARAVRAEVEHARGAAMDLGCHFNDRRERTGSISVPTREPRMDPGMLREQSRILFLDSHPRVDTRFHLHAMDELPGSVELELTCDTRYVPVRAMCEILWAIEALAVAAADRDLTPDEIISTVDVIPASRGTAWVRRGRGWTDLAAVRQLWVDLVGEEGMVFTERGPNGHHRLIAYHATGSDSPNLHRAFLNLIGERTDVQTPDIYHSCQAAPEDPHDEAAWRLIPILSSGTGRIGNEEFMLRTPSDPSD